MKKAIYILTFLITFVALNAQIQVKINNRTGYDVDSTWIGGNYIGIIKKDASVIVNNVSRLLLLHGVPVGNVAGILIGYHGQTGQMEKSKMEDVGFCGTGMKLMDYGEYEYDLVASINWRGYMLYYTKAVMVETIVSENFTGTYLSLNDEGDKLAAICKEGMLKINENGTFNYILTPDKVWCPDMKEWTYEGACLEKNDTLYLYAKDHMQLTEPKFSFTETDLNNEITISFYNDAGDLIDIEAAQSISSTKKDMYRNSFKVPFEKNYIKINDKRLLGIAVKPVDYPEVQIVLKKIKAGAKINVTLFNNYYDTFFSNRKFINSYNVLTEVSNNGKTPTNYLKNK